MEIRFTRTTEYVIDVDPDDYATLWALRDTLRAKGVEGEYLVDMLAEVYATDVDEVLEALIPLADVAGDDFVTDSVDDDDLEHPFREPDDDDDDEVTSDLRIGAEVTGAGFVPASLT